jgi:hypothetical protein
LNVHRLLLCAAFCAAATSAGQASAESLRWCDRPLPLSAQQQDRLLRFAAIVKGELDASGQTVALLARSGLDLQRFGVRYSHAGVSLKASTDGPWTVRQLYYACEEDRPRLYDQGMAGFLFGTDNPDLGYVSIVLVPRAEAAQLERTVLDKAGVLRLLSATYSANAYPFSTRYQNCNQWVMEVLASAWGTLGDNGSLRAQAQAWLIEQGYAPQPIEVGSPLLMFAALFVPWIHFDDHPDEALAAMRFQVSMPASIEAFVRNRVPGVERIELCHDERQVVIRRGWTPLAAGCQPRPDDRVVVFD